MANKNIGSRGPRHTDEERFLSKVTIGAPDECWLWTGTTTGSHTKYGRFWDGTYRPGPVGRSHMIGAHIWAFKHFVRDPGDLHVLHTCDMGLCVNWVQHLFAGTHADNMRDRDIKGRGEVPDMRGFVRGRGHILTAEQVLAIRASFTGQRGDILRIAREFGVSHAQVSRIIHEKSWKPL
jgi:hypothetical protein